jgi:hypothetical protein
VGPQNWAIKNDLSSVYQAEQTTTYPNSQLEKSLQTSSSENRHKSPRAPYDPLGDAEGA